MATLALRLPGLAYIGALTVLAFAVAHFTGSFGVGATALAVVFGFVVAHLRPAGRVLLPGVRFARSEVLTTAVVLLGLRVTWQDLAGTGQVSLATAVVAVFGVVLFALVLGALLRVDGRLSALIGAGTGVCGVSAIAASKRAVKAHEGDVTYAVASIVFLGTVGLFVLPTMQIIWHPIDPAHYGILAGATLHSVPQAVGAGFAGAGAEAGALATVTKLARVALLGPLVFGLALLFRPRGQTGGLPRPPVEVWGFLLLFALGSLVPVPEAVRAWVGFVDRILLVFALAALGATTHFSDLKQAGVRPFLLATLVWVGWTVVLVLALRTL